LDLFTELFDGVQTAGHPRCAISFADTFANVLDYYKTCRKVWSLNAGLIDIIGFNH
jgi:hypothetical protein